MMLLLLDSGMDGKLFPGGDYAEMEELFTRGQDVSLRKTSFSLLVYSPSLRWLLRLGMEGGLVSLKRADTDEDMFTIVNMALTAPLESLPKWVDADYFHGRNGERAKVMMRARLSGILPEESKG